MSPLYLIQDLFLTPSAKLTDVAFIFSVLVEIEFKILAG